MIILPRSEDDQVKCQVSGKMPMSRVLRRAILMSVERFQREEQSDLCDWPLDGGLINLQHGPKPITINTRLAKG